MIVSQTATAAAQTTGLPPNVARVITRLERAGGPVGDEQAADRQAVGQSLRERDRIGADAELLEREERARAADARLHLVEHEQRPGLVRELARCGDERCVEGDDAALAEDRLEQDAAGVFADGGGERAGVVRRGELDRGQERLERRALRGLPGDRERSGRAAVERAFERNDARLAGRLACVLERGLDRLGARVAEERLPPPSRADSRSESSAIGSVQYRLDTCQRRSSCSCAAASGAGCRCPSPTTAIPPRKSR